MISLAQRELDSIKLINPLKINEYLSNLNPQLAHVCAVLLDIDWDNSWEVIKSMSISEKVYIAEEALSFGYENLITELVGDSIAVALLLYKQNKDLDYIRDTSGYYRENYSPIEYINLLSDNLIGFEGSLDSKSSLDLKDIQLNNNGFNNIFHDFKCNILNWRWSDSSEEKVDFLKNIEGPSFISNSLVHLKLLEIEHIDNRMFKDSHFLQQGGIDRNLIKEGGTWLLKTSIGAIPVAGNVIMGLYDGVNSYLELPDTQEQLFLKITNESCNKNNIYDNYKNYLTAHIQSKLSSSVKLVVDIDASFEIFCNELIDFYLSDLDDKEKVVFKYYKMINKKEANFLFIRSKIKDSIDSDYKKYYNKVYEL